jgi:phenylalanyl-tRNA synthetase alpha chain
MHKTIEDLLNQVEAFAGKSEKEIEEFRIKMLSKKGLISELFNKFKEVPKEQKKEFGQKINELKNKATDKINELKANVSNGDSLTDTKVDFTLPSNFSDLGARHPVSLVKNEIAQIFNRLGFTISEGPEIEDDWHVFSALNFPEEHPARDMQDTFFIEKDPDVILRTHTSSVQVHELEDLPLPIRSINIGRVFRNEAISARSHCIFHQVEGLYVDKQVSFADLKQTLLFFAKEMFGNKTQIRLRPSYFPFTEPSAEMDISCSICGGKGCNLCKGTGWLEILGCGMVDPNVLKNTGVDPKEYKGFAFGIGIERTAMLRFGITDIRMLFENDYKFNSQFENIVI